jgi:hypothetical protein
MAPILDSQIQGGYEKIGDNNLHGLELLWRGIKMSVESNKMKDVKVLSRVSGVHLEQKIELDTLFSSLSKLTASQMAYLDSWKILKVKSKVYGM